MNRSLLILALLAGLALRIFGLSHDLGDGFIYHPDTPKQISATERFLHGKYYAHFGMSDYDGYPAFNSHLVEYIVRVVRPALNAATSVMGITHDDTWPDTMALYWFTRLLNVLLATLLIWVVYRIGVENFDARAGLLAAWFLALSPVDMSSAHVETCDTTASFFAIVCVLYAMRIFRHGRNIDYVLAAFFGMCAFAAKYNAGIAMVAPVAAHVLRQKRWFDVFDSESFGQLLLFGLTTIVGLFLTTPSMFIHPIIVPQEIVSFFKHVSSGKRLPEGLKDASLLGRFAFSMQRNGPILVTILSPPLALVSLLGLGHLLRWNRAMLILYSLPLVYFLLGVSLRPLSHPIYHTMMTPVLFVICAVCLLQLYDANRAGAGVAALLILVAAGFLLTKSAEEGFYYWHRDTRRMAQAWTRENVPASFYTETARYTFDLDDYGAAAAGAGPSGVLQVTTDLRGKKARAGLFFLKEFDLESDPLPFFRNPQISLFTWSASLRSGFLMPVYQRAPSKDGNEIIFDGGPEFVRSEKIFNLRKDQPVRRVLVTPDALARAAIVLQNGVQPSVITVCFAGRSEDVFLKAGERRVLTYDKPRPGFPSGPERRFYRLQAVSQIGDARMTLATTPVDEAVALYNNGLYAEAAPLLARVASETDNPTLAAYAQIAALLGGVDQPADVRARMDHMTDIFKGTWTAARMLDVYGIGPDYLGTLEFVTYPADHLPYVGFERVVDRAAEDGAAIRTLPGDRHYCALGLPSLFLEAGNYQLEVDTRSPPEGETVLNTELLVQDGGLTSLDKASGGAFVNAVKSVTLTNRCDFAPSRLALEIPHGQGQESLLLMDKGGTPLTIDSIRIKPDALATMNALGRVVGLISGWLAPADMTDLAAYRPLLALGDRLAATGAVDRAIDCYAAAARLCPALAEPAGKLFRLRDTMSPEQRDATKQFTDVFAATAADREYHEVKATFAPGVRLEGFRVSARRLQRKDEFGINLYWSIDRKDVDVDALAVWVHVVNESGEPAFQADHPLAEDLVRNPAMSELEPQFFTVPVPTRSRVAPYKILVGLCNPDGTKRFKLTSTSLAVRKDGVVLPEDVRIVP